MAVEDQAPDQPPATAPRPPKVRPRGLLLELSIRDFAIIDHLRLSLEEGLNALTGETGAGKSILIDALSAVLGDRFGPNVVRAGADRAVVDATFQCPQTLPEGLPIDQEEEVLILSREIGANGRSSARLNGRVVPASMLQAAGRALVDMHGQSDHQALLRANTHLRFLDRFARLEPQRERVAGLVNELRRVRREIESIAADDRERARQQDLLRFQVGEIEAADLQPTEEEELQRKRSILANAEKLREISALALDSLDSESGALDGALAAAKHVEDLARLDPSVEPHTESLGAAVAALQDVQHALARYMDAIEADPAELQRVEDRLDLIRLLKRKYGDSTEAVLTFANTARQQLELLTNSEARLRELREREGRLLAQAQDAAAKLSELRSQAASKLSEAVESQLSDLSMQGARFTVDICRREDEDALQPSGIDDVEFLMSANPGEPLRPLLQVASGGEASRLMLALKSVFSAVDETPVLVFDEIEAGVGARSGQVIGEKLRRLAEHHQVLCITHLAPVAACADAHFRVRKSSTSESTTTSVERLEGDERIEELAEMLAGRPITNSARDSARALMENQLRQAASFPLPGEERGPMSIQTSLPLHD